MSSSRGFDDAEATHTYTDPYERTFEDPFAISETDESADLGYSAAPAVTPSHTPTHGGAYTTPSRDTYDASHAEPVSTSPSDLAAALSAQYAALPTLNKGYQPQNEKKYLSYERRSLWGQAGYNVGYSYFGGLILGGAAGIVQGFKNSPNYRPRILLNSVLNGSGKFGARAGNAAGIMAILYTVLERQFEDVEIDRFPAMINNAIGKDILPRSRSDLVIPACTAFTAGMLFTLPRAITMKGIDRVYVSPVKRLGVMVTGGIATTIGIAALAVVGPMVFGHRSPFRFAS